MKNSILAIALAVFSLPQAFGAAVVNKTNFFPNVRVAGDLTANTARITNAVLVTPNIGAATATSVTASADVQGAVLQSTKAIRSYQGSLTHAGTVTLDFDATTTVNPLALTGNVTFVTSNLASNRTYRVRITGTSTNATPTFPAWNFLGGAPSTITASKVGMLSLEAWGTTDASVVAAYAEAQ